MGRKRKNQDLPTVPFGGYVLDLSNQLEITIVAYNRIRGNLGFEPVPNDMINDHIVQFYERPSFFYCMVKERFLLEPLLCERDSVTGDELKAQRAAYITAAGEELRSKPVALFGISKEEKQRRALTKQARRVKLKREFRFHPMEFAKPFCGATHLAEQLEYQKALLVEENSQDHVVATRRTTRAGFVYLATSPSFPGWVKVGSTLDLAQRLVGFNTHSPYGDFTFDFFQHFSDRVCSEKEIHAKFAEHRGKGEWFRITLEEAKQAVLQLAKEKVTNL